MKSLLLLLSLFVQHSLLAQDSNSLQSTLVGGESQYVIKDYVYESQQWLSDGLVMFSNKVDSFFGEKSSLLEQNGTRIRIFNVWRNEENRTPTQEFYFKLDFKLPNLQKRLQFNLEKQGKSEEGDFLETEKRISQEERIQDDKDMRAGFSYLFDEFKKYSLKFSAGLTLSQKLTPYSKFNIKRNYSLFTGNLEFGALTYWDNQEGLTENIKLNYSKKLNDDFIFYLINDAKWFKSTEETLITQGPTLHHRLSDRRDIYYNLRMNSSTKPNYTRDSYLASITYRQRIMRNWFFYEISPYLKFPRADNFKKVEGILLNLKAVIGSL